MIYPRILQKVDNFIVKTVDKYANFRWYNSPLTKKVMATKEEYLATAKKAKEKKYPLVDEQEKIFDAKIDDIWLHELALHTQVVKKKSEICYVHGRLLYACLVNYLKTSKLQYVSILETGTALGFSSLCMAKALNDLNIQGTIHTFDVLPHNKKMYWTSIDDHDGKKTRAELLVNYSPITDKYIVYYQGNTKIILPKIYFARIHFAFLDSTHDYYYLMAEFHYIKTKQEKGDIIFFDDYTPAKFPGVVKAVDDICTNYNYSKQIITISQARAYVISIKL